MDNRKLILRLFPYINNKNRAKQLKIDSESIHYISLREIANKISNIIKHHLLRNKIQSKNVYITDATAGVGGDTISFGMTFGNVNSIEINELRYEYLINNINVYELKNIKTYNDNCLSLLATIKKQTVVFIDPPWGGKTYKMHKKLKLNIDNIEIETICNNLLDPNKTKSVPYLIALKLPTNYDLKYLFNNIKSKMIYLHKLKKMFIIIIVNELFNQDKSISV